MAEFIGSIKEFTKFIGAYARIKVMHNNGLISFGKAFKIGFFIALIASTMYVVVWAIVYHFFIPDFMDLYAAQMMKQAEGGSAIEMEQKADEMMQYKEMYKNPLFFTLMTYTEILPVGLLVSLITGFILKRK